MKKTLITILATVLVCCCVVGGTLAWLVDQTEAVTNTFTVGKVEIELTETTGSEYPLIPGTEHEKNPTITVSDDSERCYVFVKVIEKNNTGDTQDAKYVEYSINSSWTALTGVDNVYWQLVDGGAELPILAGNTVTISSTNVTNAVTVAPTITFTAYAVQAENMDDAADAWTAGGFN